MRLHRVESFGTLAFPLPSRNCNFKVQLHALRQSGLTDAVQRMLAVIFNSEGRKQFDWKCGSPQLATSVHLGLVAIRPANHRLSREVANTFSVLIWYGRITDSINRIVFIFCEYSSVADTGVALALTRRYRSVTPPRFPVM